MKLAEMTLNEYLQYALAKAVAKMAEDDGVKIIDGDKPRPRLVTKEGTVVMLRQEPES